MERFIACTNPILASFKSQICRSFTSINTCKLTAPNPQISSKNLAKKCKFQAYKLLQKCRSWCRKMRENSKSVCIQSNIWSSTEKTHKQKRQNAKKIITRRKSIVVFCSLVSQIYSGVVVATGRRVTLGTTFSTTKE